MAEAKAEGGAAEGGQADAGGSGSPLDFEGGDGTAGEEGTEEALGFGGGGGEVGGGAAGAREEVEGAGDGRRVPGDVGGLDALGGTNRAIVLDEVSPDRVGEAGGRPAEVGLEGAEEAALAGGVGRVGDVG